ncbi:hypothetical protein [Mucilaginibacter sp.]|jgi:hypothetical protein|uniref:hypothetical protein n=1 Tax=Mucilaginibacter sp. TaxID=1882438 RepID=UPI002B61951D|nr:hypothetical protein [Mucilaginibacter sp.]HTI60219.1 hypothetical protein [Mucilaginibacter sp.]
MDGEHKLAYRSQTHREDVFNCFREICSAKVYRYTVAGHGSQLLELMPDFRIFVSGYFHSRHAVEAGATWELKDEPDGVPTLVISTGNNGSSYTLRKDENGDWKGQQLLQAQPDILLEPVYATCTEEEKTYYRSLQENFVASLSDHPIATGAGKGIIIPGGGEKYFIGAWVLINILRETLGCTLPIELWHLGTDEIPARLVPELQRLNVQCCDAYNEGNAPIIGQMSGWALKPYALLNSRFAEVLLLDADNIPVRNPEYLFDDPSFKKTGSVFWPDFGALSEHRPIWEVCGVTYYQEAEFESGQLLVDRLKHYNALRLAMFYNQHNNFFYRLVNGDKETFHMAWRRLGIDYTIVPKPILHLHCTMVQHDMSGKPLFQHRYGDKWLKDDQNLTIDGFIHERECKQFIKLAEEKLYNNR